MPSRYLRVNALMWVHIALLRMAMIYFEGAISGYECLVASVQGLQSGVDA
jgi:hypothetical protein